MEELLFAWKVAKHVKSNAIVVTRDRTTLGGAGQMNGFVKIALEQAGEKLKEQFSLVMDSFDDSVRGRCCGDKRDRTAGRQFTRSRFHSGGKSAGWLWSSPVFVTFALRF